MLLKAYNKQLVKDREKTYLTASVASGGTTLTVRAVDANAWADNDYIIVGEIGIKTAEVLQINGAVSDGTSLTIDQSGSGGARYAHSVDEPVYRIDYNKVQFAHTTTTTGSKTALVTNEIQPDEEFTRYEDTTYTTGYGFIRFYNQTTAVYSDYSVAVPYTGYTAKSLFRIIKNVRRLLNLDDTDNQVSDEDIIDEINEKQRDVYHERLWSFAEADFSFSGVKYQETYDIQNRISKVHTLTYDSQPLVKIPRQRWEVLHWDTNNSSDPTHFSEWNRQLKVYPLTNEAAATTTLNGVVTATTTSITLTSINNLRAPGRIIVDSEVIGFAYIDSTNIAIKGCERGLEGTTAAAHLTLAVVTERDFIGAGHLEPTEIKEMDDETGIPDPRVLEYGSSMELALMKLNNQVLHDRLKVKYDESLKRLRDKFGIKITSQFTTIKDKNDYPRDYGTLIDPMDNPTNITD